MRGGQTPTVAQYVQASSRSGRANVGLVLVSFDRRSARERAFFTYFREYHAFLTTPPDYSGMGMGF